MEAIGQGVQFMLVGLSVVFVFLVEAERQCVSAPMVISLSPRGARSWKNQLSKSSCFILCSLAHFCIFALLLSSTLPTCEVWKELQIITILRAEAIFRGKFS